MSGVTGGAKGRGGCFRDIFVYHYAISFSPLVERIERKQGRKEKKERRRRRE